MSRQEGSKKLPSFEELASIARRTGQDKTANRLEKVKEFANEKEEKVSSLRMQLDAWRLKDGAFRDQTAYINVYEQLRKVLDKKQPERTEVARVYADFSNWVSTHGGEKEWRQNIKEVKEKFAALKEQDSKQEKVEKERVEKEAEELGELASKRFLELTEGEEDLLPVEKDDLIGRLKKAMYEWSLKDQMFRGVGGYQDVYQKLAAAVDAGEVDKAKEAFAAFQEWISAQKDILKHLDRSDKFLPGEKTEDLLPVEKDDQLPVEKALDKGLPVEKKQVDKESWPAPFRELDDLRTKSARSGLSDEEKVRLTALEQEVARISVPVVMEEELNRQEKFASDIIDQSSVEKDFVVDVRKKLNDWDSKDGSIRDIPEYAQLYRRLRRALDAKRPLRGEVGEAYRNFIDWIFKNGMGDKWTGTEEENNETETAEFVLQLNEAMNAWQQLKDGHFRERPGFKEVYEVLRKALDRKNVVLAEITAAYNAFLNWLDAQKDGSRENWEEVRKQTEELLARMRQEPGETKTETFAPASETEKLESLPKEKETSGVETPSEKTGLGRFLDRFIRKHVKGEYLEEEQTDKLTAARVAKGIGSGLLGLAATFGGVKSFADVPRWWLQKRYTGQEIEKLKGIFEKNVEPSPHVEMPPSPVELRKQTLLDAVEKSPYFNEEKRAGFRKQLDRIFENFTQEKEKTDDTQLNEAVFKLIDETIEARVKGTVALKETLNTLFWTVAPLRLAAYGGVSLLERWQKVSKEIERGERTESKAKEFVVNGFVETWNKLRFKGEGKFGRKAMNAGQAALTVSRFVMLGSLAIPEGLELLDSDSVGEAANKAKEHLSQFIDSALNAWDEKSIPEILSDDMAERYTHLIGAFHTATEAVSHPMDTASGLLGKAKHAVKRVFGNETKVPADIGRGIGELEGEEGELPTPISEGDEGLEGDSSTEIGKDSGSGHTELGGSDIAPAHSWDSSLHGYSGEKMQELYDRGLVHAGEGTNSITGLLARQFHGDASLGVPADQANRLAQEMAAKAGFLDTDGGETWLTSAAREHLSVVPVQEAGEWHIAFVDEHGVRLSEEALKTQGLTMDMTAEELLVRRGGMTKELSSSATPHAPEPVHSESGELASTDMGRPEILKPEFVYDAEGKITDLRYTYGLPENAEAKQEVLQKIFFLAHPEASVIPEGYEPSASELDLYAHHRVLENAIPNSAEQTYLRELIDQDTSHIEASFVEISNLGTARFEYNDSGDVVRLVSDMRLTGQEATDARQFMLKGDWRLSLKEGVDVSMSQDVLSDNARNLFIGERVFQNLESRGLEDSPEAKFLLKQMRHVVDTIEKTRGDVFDHENGLYKLLFPPKEN